MANPKIVKQLINRRVGELGTLLGTNVDLDTIQGKSATQAMERYKKLLKKQFNLSVEEAAKLLETGFASQRAQASSSRQFAR